jgi:hypothetical protein
MHEMKRRLKAEATAAVDKQAAEQEKVSRIDFIYVMLAHQRLYLYVVFIYSPIIRSKRKKKKKQEYTLMSV